MRRTLIQKLLPFCFCLVPLLAMVLVVAAIPQKAQSYYLDHLRHSQLDWLILGVGLFLFCVQMLLAWRSLQWRGASFDEGPDRWLTNLAQAAEWFPMLGLIGTVAGILQTFGSITGPVSPREVITLFTPAITATGSGLLMALFNILPAWVVLIGRDLILALGGGASSSVEVHS
ncbi:MAG: hypothetical protein KatS3mg105_3951 [Gemmatales bacterium]|nr:MAG: hypothetical protein KatS3mg105_3951 [Gemmatales bacterium]